MADRIYKGRLVPIQDKAFPEAACDFHKPHKGGLIPFELLRSILKCAAERWRNFDLQEVQDAHEDCTLLGGEEPIQVINGSIWIHGDGAWVKIEPDGSIEIGTSGV